MEKREAAQEEQMSAAKKRLVFSRQEKRNW